jgi:Flp pilus assembly protein TadD
LNPPANESEIVLRATELVSQGEPEKAEQLLRQLVKSGSTLAKAWMNLGVLVGDRGDKVERLKLFNHARELEPNNADVLLNLATAQTTKTAISTAPKRLSARCCIRMPS